MIFRIDCQCPEDNVAEYCQQQVEMLEGFTEMDALAERGFIPGMSKEEQEKWAKSETFAIRISNMVLFAAKVYASLRSGSLAIIASTLDSLLNLLSGFILWFTAFSTQTPNPYQYPIGKKRMQPLSLKRLSEEIVETAETESGFTMFPMSMGLKGRFMCNPALNFLNCGFPSLEKMVELRQQISGRETVQEVELVQGEDTLARRVGYLD